MNNPAGNLAHEPFDARIVAFGFPKVDRLMAMTMQKIVIWSRGFDREGHLSRLFA
jgi:hypothetical protein